MLAAAALMVLPAAAPRAGALRAQAAAVDGRVDAAVRLFEARRYDEAAPLLAAAASADPRDPRPPFYLGRIAVAHGDADEAVRQLEAATRVDPRNAEYYFWLGRAYARQVQRTGRLRQAFVARRSKQAFETALRLDPDDLAARGALLQYLLVAPAVAGGSTSDARAQAEELRRRSRLYGLMAAGWIAEADGKGGDAEAQFVAATTEFPDSTQGYYALGALYQRQRQYEKAFDVYERLLRRRSDAANAYYNIGRTASQSGTRLERAEQALKSYIARKPAREDDAPLASAHYRLGMVYEQMGRPELAREQYREALRVDPKQPDAAGALKRLR